MPWTSPSAGSRRAISLLAVLLSAGHLAVSQAPPAPPAPAAAPPAPPPPRFVVVLDAAHGGDDGGAKLATQPEKDLTLALSVRLRSLLTARGITAITTRESDAPVDANHRAEIANHARAQACLSLHATQSGLGVHLFVSSLPPAQPLRMAPWKTAQAPWITRSLALAGVLNAALQQAGVGVTVGRTALPVVESMACPAVAVELAPPGKPPGRAPEGETGPAPVSLDDPAYQSRVADALAAALLEWKTDPSRMEDALP